MSKLSKFWMVVGLVFVVGVPVGAYAYIEQTHLQACESNMQQYMGSGSNSVMQHGTMHPSIEVN